MRGQLADLLGLVTDQIGFDFVLPGKIKINYSDWIKSGAGEMPTVI